MHTLKPPPPDPVVTDRFRFTTNGMLTPGLAHIDMDGFNHPAYQRPSDPASPYMRIKAQIACSHVPESRSWQDLRGRFLGMATHEWLMSLISEVTVIRQDAIWRSRGASRRSWLDADLTSPDDSHVPAASARLMLPESGPAPFGAEARCALMIVHIDLPQGQARSLAFWRKQITRALNMPRDLDGLLRGDLGLTPANDPPAQVAILLSTQGHPLTEIVSPGCIKRLTARYFAAESIGFAVATPEGKTVDETAKDYMPDLSMRVLHLDGTDDEMSGEQAALA
jgi:hypothetical protein